MYVSFASESSWLVAIPTKQTHTLRSLLSGWSLWPFPPRLTIQPTPSRLSTSWEAFCEYHIQRNKSQEDIFTASCRCGFSKGYSFICKLSFHTKSVLGRKSYRDHREEGSDLRCSLHHDLNKKFSPQDCVSNVILLYFERPLEVGVELAEVGNYEWGFESYLLCWRPCSWLPGWPWCDLSLQCTPKFHHFPPILVRIP